MIRFAHRSDRDAVLRMAQDFISASKLPIDFNAAWASASFERWVEDSDKLALVLDLDGVKGILCAAWSLSPLSPVRISQEQMFWIDPTARGAWANGMIEAYEGWAKSQGCDIVGLAALSDRMPIYTRRGFRRAETHFVRAI